MKSRVFCVFGAKIESGVTCHKIVWKIVSFWGKIGAVVGAGGLSQVLKAKFAWCLSMLELFYKFLSIEY